MRTMRALFLLAWVTAPNTARGESNDVLKARAERAFQEGLDHRLKPLKARQAFSEDADCFRALHDNGVRSPEVYLDLGNAAMLADRWPEALWAYDMGLILDPNDRQLRDNRDFVRGKVVYPSSQARPQADIWPTWLYRPSPPWLAGIAFSSYALAWLAGTGAYLWRRPWLVKTAVLATLVAAGAGLDLWYEIDQAQTDRETPLVVVKENTFLYRGNGTNYPQHPDLPLLPRGIEARQQHRRGAWLLVRLSSGEVGWVPAERVLVVEP